MSLWSQNLVKLSIHNHVLCVFLFMAHYSICIVHSWALNSLPTALWLISKQRLFNKPISSVRHITAFLNLGKLDSNFTLSWDHYIQQNQQKHKNMALNVWQKRNTFLQNKKQNKDRWALSCWTSSVPKPVKHLTGFVALLMSMNDCEVVQLLIWEL